ncbi:MAG TPA: hypothetical protein VEC57_20930 [Candidatus Limnocylindrales bacterium]|nr:hypothetical protein [Candidatus Limnocylindrales bacterium]
MMFLARYWRVLAVASAIGAILYGIQLALDNAEQRGYDRATAEGKAAIAALDAATAAREAEEREISRTHDVAYQEKSRALQSQIDRLTARTVDIGRLRGCADRGSAAATSQASSTPVTDGAAGRAIDDLPAGGDHRGGLGLQLIRYAAACERQRQQLIGLQSWVSDVLEPTHTRP